ncbi:MAG: FAD-dependent oxidoreductase [Magnetococcales bacterium]|nr:FAD-dependent oxidoreductase [Magnetococcales bacterium]NGZ27013.1 FAD-dependent oxidoreductase [Magnetococcales bacterium]
MSLPSTTDFLIIGGGVMGLALALETRRLYPLSTIVVLEKESQCGLHASGRNSGVLHAGFYYTADSLKARFSQEGNQWWQNYCKEQKLPLNSCGKLVVARHEGELAGLDELKRRGDANGVPLEMVSAEEARRLEPRVKTCQRALFSPTTASLDPKMAMTRLVRDASREGIILATRTSFLSRQQDQVTTNRGKITAGYVINAAGLYADQIARAYGFANEYTILPFKGLYLYGREGCPPLNLHIYPVPDLANPFLGVHFTVTMMGGVKIGPTAIPAFWRQHYRGMENFNLQEAITILGLQAALFWRNDFNFRRLAMQELAKQSRGQMIKLAKDLLEGVYKMDFPVWGLPGLRAQLFNLESNKLEMDFRYQGDRHSFHVLNAVSPGFTCAFPFAKFLLQQVTEVSGIRP